MSSLNIDATNSTTWSEIRELLSSIAEERTKYFQNKLLEESAYECINDGDIDATLANKVNNILMDSEVIKSNEIQPGKSILVNSILSNDTCLEPDEGEIVNSAVQKKLKSKEKDIAEELLHLGFNMHSKSELNELHNYEKEETKALLELKSDLDDKQRSYIECLKNLLSVYEEILKLKFETFPGVVNDKVELLQTQTDTMQLKAELLNTNAKISMFSETNRSLHAYKEILKDIQQEHREHEEELKKLREIRDKYKNVSCKQFNEMLEKYLVYKTKLDSLKL